jgi:multidrug efflux pump subunit AcrB
LDRLIRYFAERYLVVQVMVATVVVLGYATATRTPREGMPNVTMPIIQLTATLAGAAARDVETKVTIPIEDAIEEVDGIKSFYTVISDNFSATTIELYEDYDEAQIRAAEQDIRQAVDAINDFPPEMDEEPVIARANPGKFPVLEIALSGPIEAVVRAAKVLERRIRPLDTVARVTLVGLQDPEVRVLVDPERAREHGVTLLEVVRAVERRNVSSTGGMLETDRDRRQVVLWSRYRRPEEVGETVLRFLPGGGAVRVADVARIESGREDTGLLAHTNGEPGISVVIRKRETADILDCVDAVRRVVETTPLPPGVHYALVDDESFETRNRLELMANNGMIGLVLVAIVLFGFLTPAAGIWVMVQIPLVFLGVLAVMPHVGITLNIISLAGFVVVLGMLVDNAVVVAERITVKRQEGLDRLEAAVRGTSEVARPVTAAAVTTVLAFLPMWAIGGLPGKVAWNIPAVVVLALLFALFGAFFILPSHLSGARTGGKEAAKRGFVVRMEARYRRVLGLVLHHRALVVGAALVVFLAIMLGLAPRAGFVMFPQDDSDALYLKVTTPLGTPLEQTEAVAASLERQLPDLIGKDLVAVTARVGHNQTARRFAPDRERGSAENEALISALFRNVGRERTSAEWIQELERTLVVPDSVEVVYEADMIGPVHGLPVTVHVESNDNQVRRGAALEVAEWLRGIDGVSNVEIDERPGTPQLDLNLDYQKLALRGLDAEDVGLTLKAAFFGLVASEHRDLDDTTDIRVMFDPSARRSLDALLETPVRATGGELVRLRDVVKPLDFPGVSTIYHREGRRTATVSASFVPGSPHTALSMAARVEKELVPRFARIRGLHIYNGGEAEDTREVTADLGVAAILAVIGITVVITLMLGSLLESLFVVAVVPFSAAAVVLTFFLHGKPLSLLAMLGAIGLAGVVVNAAIVMVDAIHRQLRMVDADDPHARREAIIDAVVARLRPVLVTSLTTLGGVMPTAYGLGGYDAVVSPMSLALGWGLALSTLVTLLLVPTLYTLAGDLRGLGSRDRVAALLARARRQSPSQLPVRPGNGDPPASGTPAPPPPAS